MRFCRNPLDPFWRTSVGTRDKCVRLRNRPGEADKQSHAKRQLLERKERCAPINAPRVAGGPSSGALDTVNASGSICTTTAADLCGNKNCPWHCNRRPRRKRRMVHK
ncbi:unnamed protein product [Ixodes pacificus]